MTAGRAHAAPAAADALAPIANFKFDIESEKGWVGPAGSAK